MEIRSQIGSLGPRTCLCGPHSILKIFDLTANIFRWGNFTSNSKCPFHVLLKNWKLWHHWGTHFARQSQEGAHAGPFTPASLKNPRGVLPGTFFFLPINVPNNEAHLVKDGLCYFSPLLFYHAINNSIQNQTEAYQSCDKPLIINYFKENT